MGRENSGVVGAGVRRSPVSPFCPCSVVKRPRSNDRTRRTTPVSTTTVEGGAAVATDHVSNNKLSAYRPVVIAISQRDETRASGSFGQPRGGFRFERRIKSNERTQTIGTIRQ